MIRIINKKNVKFYSTCRLAVSTTQRFSQQKLNDEDDKVFIKGIGNIKSSVYKDLFDFEGQIENFKIKNEQQRQLKQQGIVQNHIESPHVKHQLKQLLGKNFDRYAETLYQIEGQDLDSKADPHVEYSAGSPFHTAYNWFSRIFQDEENLLKMRQSESKGFQGLLNKYPNCAQYPFDDLNSLFKPREFCKELNDNQLILFNIPLDVNEEEIKEFVKTKLQQGDILNIHIEVCKLNMNSSAIITLDKVEIDVAKQQLNSTRFNGCLLDAKCKKDDKFEGAWDRTLVLLNLDPEWSYQEILHRASEFGRVTNFVIPQRQGNEDLPTEDELIECLERDPSQQGIPVKIIVYDIEKNSVESRYWPSEEQFMEWSKSQTPYNEEDGSIVEFQLDSLQKEMQQRMMFLKSEQQYQCIRVPLHLKDTFKKLWVPTLDEDKKLLKPLEQQLKKFYLKDYLNLGFCLITYNSKLMAQRALYRLNSKSSTDLSILQTPLANQPVFYNQNLEKHSDHERYGHKFLVENYLFRKHSKNIQAIKGWEGMELYNVDSAYILNQLEKYRIETSLQVDKIRTEVRGEGTTIQETDFVDKKEELRQRIFQELSQPLNANEFDKRVEVSNFSQQDDSLELQTKPILNNAPGRQFDVTLTEQDYVDQVNILIQRQGQIQQKEITYVDRLIQENQQELKQQRMKDKYSSIPLLQGDKHQVEIQAKLIKTFREKNEQEEKLIDKIDEDLEKAADKIYDEDIKQASYLKRKEQQKARILELQQKKENKTKNLTNKQESQFCSSNPFYHQKQRVSKHQNFLEEIKLMMFGQFTAKQKEEIYSHNDLNDIDSLKGAQIFEKDAQGQPYLSNKVIEQLKEFDYPQDEIDRLHVQQQEFNRKYLISQIPTNFWKHYFVDSQKNLTNLILENYEIGMPTEAFKVQADVDGKRLASELNQYVANSGEQYFNEIDPQTKASYIIKSEKPFYKYDLNIISKLDKEQIENQMVDLLMEDQQISKSKAQLIIKDFQSSGQSTVIADLLNKSKLEFLSSDIDVESLCREMNMSKKEVEFYLQNDILNESELFEEEVGEQYAMEKLRLSQTYNKDTVIKDTDSDQYKVKDKAGKYNIPKFRKI